MDPSSTLLASLEDKRTKINVPSSTLKKLDKELQRKKIFWNENIMIRCPDKNGVAGPGCQWLVPRSKLLPSFLCDLVQRCPNPVQVDYVRDADTGDVVWLSDVQLQCKSKPYEWTVIAKEQRVLVDSACDPRYQGDLRLMLRSAPLRTENELFAVLPSDIKCWLLYGLLEEDHEMQDAREVLAGLEAEVAAIDKRLERAAYTAQKTRGSEESQAAARVAHYASIVLEKEAAAAHVADAKALLEKMESSRRKIDINIQRLSSSSSRRSNNSSGAQDNPSSSSSSVNSLNSAASAGRDELTCTYLLQFQGANRAAMEDLLVTKRDWPGIKLAVQNAELPAWAGRGVIPDGSKAYLPRYTELGVNMRGAQLCRLPHGFGEYKIATQIGTNSSSSGRRSVTGNRQSIAQPSSPAAAAASATAAATAVDETPAGTESAAPTIYGAQFSFYHGHFVEGERHGPGILYSETGTFYGSFDKGQRRGAGHEHCTDGTHISGYYSAGERFAAGRHSAAAAAAGGSTTSTASVSSSNNASHSSNSSSSSSSSSNPYAMGMLNGFANISFPDGATYVGEMCDGRVTGNGVYTGVLGEVLKGSFVNGELHGDNCSSMDAAGRYFEGTFVRGALQCSGGRSSSAHMGSYCGDFERGQRVGKGEAVLPSGTVHRGMYLDGDRCGIGTAYKGNVKNTLTAAGAHELKSNRVYEGHWRGGTLRGGGMLTCTRKQSVHCVSEGSKGQWSRAIHRMHAKEVLARRECDERGDFLQQFAHALREALSSEKRRIYRAQVKRANRAVIKDTAKEFTTDYLYEVYSERDSRIEQAMRITGIQVDDPTPLSQAEQNLDDVAARIGGQYRSCRSVLGSVVQSIFEELEELHQLVPVESTSEVVEAELRESMRSRAAIVRG